MAKPRILVTNDDGIDSLGLHVLAQHLTEIGDVMIVAPDQEYSGAGAAIGALHTMRPEVSKRSIEGVERAWAVTGPPGLCVMFARLGAFGPLPDLIVSGINPGANVGRSVYHSGTVGATLTGRNGMIPGLAVSQSISGFSPDLEDEEYVAMVAAQRWETAATIATTVAEAMLAEPMTEPGVLNLNVPNRDLSQLEQWQWTKVGHAPPRAMSKAVLEPKPDHEGTWEVKLSWGDEHEQEAGTDAAALQADTISLSWLSRIEALEIATPSVDHALDQLIAGQR